MPQATGCVFAPNKVPDGYVDEASIPLVLRPGAFRVQCRRCRRALSHALRRRTALSRDRGADRGHLRRSRHGRRRTDPLASGSPATSRAPNWSGSTISATSRTGSRRISSLAAIENALRGNESTCRRWRGRGARIAADAYGVGMCADLKARGRTRADLCMPGSGFGHVRIDETLPNHSARLTRCLGPA